jgi:acetyl esterase
MPLDPRAQALLEQIQAEGLPPFEEMTVPQAREVAATFKEMRISLAVSPIVWLAG